MIKPIARKPPIYTNVVHREERDEGKSWWLGKRVPEGTSIAATVIAASLLVQNASSSMNLGECRLHPAKELQLI